jgi:nitrogen regulatory protein PII
MNIKRITAIMPIDSLQSVEKYMRECGVPGVTVETVQGHGEHPDYFRKDLMKNNAKLTLYTVEEKVDEIIEALSACARELGLEHGIIAVDSVDRLVRLVDGMPGE